MSEHMVASEKFDPASVVDAVTPTRAAGPKAGAPRGGRHYRLKTPAGIERGVVETYRQIENGVVGTYRRIEDAVVGTYQRIEDAFVDRFLEVEEEGDDVRGHEEHHQVESQTWGYGQR